METVKPNNHFDAFTGLAGLFRQWAGLGIVAMDALMLFMAVFWLIPSTQDRFERLMQVERENRREEFRLMRDELKMEREWERERTGAWLERSKERDAALLKSIELNQKSIEAILVEVKGLKKGGG